MSCIKSLKLALAGFTLLGAVAMVGVALSVPAFAEALATVAVAELPRQGAQTYQLIHQGGPFAQQKDGVVFGNRERLLPARTRGYYHEYTVKTPGSRDRGTRRIVCGGQAVAPEVCYYSADHYASFRKIVP
jgi:ribonuclease T1